MPGSQREVFNAIEEGIEFNWLTLPVDYIGSENVKKVKVTKMQLGILDNSGRRISENILGSEYEVETDMIIEALGFNPENIPKLFNESNLEITKNGTLKIDFKTMMTSIEGVFAAGDIVRGASLVVWGIKDGRDAAINLNNYLKEKNLSYNYKNNNEFSDV